MKRDQKHTVFITGAAGYVGTMLCDQFAKRPDVACIVALDKEERPELLAENKKIVWITANTAGSEWQGRVAKYKPEVVIHTAWEIREMYGKQRVGERWNVGGSKNVCTFAFEQKCVQRLIHFSTAAVYGAYKDNTIEHRFTENEPLREQVYSYAREKIQAERNLHELYIAARDRVHKPMVTVVRPAAITGPRGRFARIRFGLQAALAGKLSGDIFYRIISLMVSFVPATAGWVRQFIHEDDVVDIISLLTFDTRTSHKYEVFNLAPPGKPVLAAQMAHVVGKRVLPIRPWMVRVAFFVFWHISRGKIPNGRGVWRFYSYPIVMSGEKLSRMYRYQYQYNSQDAFQYTNGRYEECVPKSEQQHQT